MVDLIFEAGCNISDSLHPFRVSVAHLSINGGTAVLTLHHFNTYVVEVLC